MKTVYIRVRVEDELPEEAGRYFVYGSDGHIEMWMFSGEAFESRVYNKYGEVTVEYWLKEVPITDLLPSDTFEAFRAGFMAHQPLSRQWGDFEEERCKKEHEKWLQ